LTKNFPSCLKVDQEDLEHADVEIVVDVAVEEIAEDEEDEAKGDLKKRKKPNGFQSPSWDAS